MEVINVLQTALDLPQPVGPTTIECVSPLSVNIVPEIIRTVNDQLPEKLTCPAAAAELPLA